MNNFQFKSYNKSNSWLGLILVFVVVFLIYIIIQSIYKLFLILAPVFLLLAAILDYRVLMKFGIVIYELLRYRTVLGILAVIFTVIGFPFVSAALFFNAFMNFKTKRKSRETTKRINHKEQRNLRFHTICKTITIYYSSYTRRDK